MCSRLILPVFDRKVIDELRAMVHFRDRHFMMMPSSFFWWYFSFFFRLAIKSVRLHVDVQWNIDSCNKSEIILSETIVSERLKKRTDVLTCLQHLLYAAFPLFCESSVICDARPAFPRERRKPQTLAGSSLINRPFLLPRVSRLSPRSSAVTRSPGARCHFGVLVIRVSSSTLPSSLPPLRHPSGSIGRPSVISRLMRKARKRRIGGLRARYRWWKRPGERKRKREEGGREKAKEGRRGSRPRPRSRWLF